MKKALITGSSGLVGSAAVSHLCNLGWKVYGIDNNMRQYLFGEEGSTDITRRQLEDKYKDFYTTSIDIRNKQDLDEFFESVGPFDYIIHAAAQPAHEWSTNHAIEDFQLNAVATVNMLETYRHRSPEAVFIQVSSSKVYGDSVNRLPLEEFSTRLDLPESHPYWTGVDEDFGRLDDSLHSLFGASKACGDIMAREYGTYFNLPINIFRPVCITGKDHKGVPLHGYLAYLVKCAVTGRKYTVNGYKGKQVRDNIHASDLVSAFYKVYEHKDRIVCGEAYNIGGGRESNNSILEALNQCEQITGNKPVWDYTEVNRRGDHKWIIYSTEKFMTRYPEWKRQYNNDKIMEELCKAYSI